MVPYCFCFRQRLRSYEQPFDTLCTRVLFHVDLVDHGGDADQRRTLDQAKRIVFSSHAVAPLAPYCRRTIRRLSLLITANEGLCLGSPTVATGQHRTGPGEKLSSLHPDLIFETYRRARGVSGQEKQDETTQSAIPH